MILPIMIFLVNNNMEEDYKPMWYHQHQLV